MSDRERSFAEESPFTLAGHVAEGSPIPDKLGAGVPLSLPPKHNYPGSPANYWLLDEQIIANMQIAITPLDPTVPVFKMPHAVVEGTVAKVISESDGDTHVWLELDNSKTQLACEWTPQSTAKPPPGAGAHIRVYGIFRYDAQHGWWELHPVDFWESI